MTEDIDRTALRDLTGKVIGDVAGAMGVLMAYIGDRAGVFRALDGAARLTLNDLATMTGLNPKYLHEWLGSVCAAGYVQHHAADETFSITPEQASIFTREGQPSCMQGFFELVVSQFAGYEKATETFLSGKGRSWGDHPACLFCGTDRFFRKGYQAHLVNDWIHVLPGVEAQLKAGAKIADVGCGHGSSTLLMAQAYPNSFVYGIDFHAPSIEEAKRAAAQAGVTNIEFHVGNAQNFAGSDYDLICMFDALHDMGDPVGAARHIRKTLAPGGTFMLVEPMAGDSMSENLHPLGQILYAASCTICTPNSLSQEVGLGLGAQAGEKRLAEVCKEAGFTDVRRVAETATNMVLAITG